MKHDFAREWAQSHRAFSVPTLPMRFLLLTTLVSLVGLTACVSTPTTPPVVSKQQSITKIIKDNTQNTNLLQGAPQTYTYNATQGAITLNVNAQVQFPATAKIPVATVQPACFDQNATDKIINTFMPGKPLYDPIPDGSNLPKAYLEKLSTLMQALQLPGAQGYKEISTQYYDNMVFRTISFPRGTSKMNATILHQMSQSAPETMYQASRTGQLQTVNESDIGKSKGYHGQMLGVDGGIAAHSGKGYDMTLSLDAFTSPRMCDVKFANHDITSVYNYAELTGNASARGMSMSLAQAKKLAQNTLQAVGASELQLTDVQLATLIPLTSAQDPNTMDQAYGLWFTRHIAGVPTTLDLTNPNPSNAAAYSYERVFMLINDSGVIEFSWTSPMHASGTVSSNAKILSFQDAMNTFKQQFFIHYAQNDLSKGKTTYTINRITLGLMRVQVKDQDNTYVMVPVWDFFGSVNPLPQAQSIMTTPPLQSLLTVNAIDGSIVDRTLGY